MEATVGTQEEKFPIILCIAGCLAFLDALCKVSVEFSSHMTIRNAPTYFIIVPRAKILPSFPIKNILVRFLTRFDGFNKLFPYCMVNDSLEKF